VNFASTPFVLLFLPLVLAAFHALRGPRAGERRMALLIAASAVFYVSAGWQNALVLGGSLTGNYLAARGLLALEHPGRRKALMWLAVLANVGLLLGFKIRILGGEGPDGFTAAEDVLLPLALSFVTFHQIGFIASIYRGTVRQVGLPAYLFFILFFPHLVMGPIVRYQDIAGQLERGALAKVDPRWVATGLAVFVLALVKKLVIANGLAGPGDEIFAAAQAGAIATTEAWFAIACFQFQLFFDFTAYAEMAIGLAMMFGMRLPLNFDRPFFARDRADLWRRWHISFSTFMRWNVFMPLVRAWRWPIPAALALTGILSGLWHGLGLTFVVWGLLQTAILLALHFRNDRRRRSGRSGWPAPLAIAATFLVTCLIGGLFRSPDLAMAGHLYGALAGLAGGEIDPDLAVAGWRGPALAALAAALIWLAPDFGQLFRGQWHYTELRAGAQPPPLHWAERAVRFEPGLRWGVVTGVALAAALVALASQGEASRFIYVQF
jgi:D-alanyl-lipoteichoic acid acyltransferase DltB (MBOAT superfamily)